MTPNTVLTDALNASFITFNGNETMLQNDMGNTLILDSTTGYVMGLNSGFIPVGMKEHGGILYIASYNPDTEEGEIGSIPSPIFEYTSVPSEKTFDTLTYLIYKADESPTTIHTYELSDFYEKKSVLISDNNFYLGDSVFPMFDFTIDPLTFTRVLYNEPGNIPNKCDFTLITLVNGKGDVKFGMFNVVPWLHPLQNSTPIRLKEWELKGIYYFGTSKDQNGKKNDMLTDDTYRYWFSTDSNIDDGLTRASQFFYNIPNVNNGGKLYLTVEEVTPIGNVEMFQLRSTKEGSPFYFIV